jgi:hypothetical protein
LGENGWYEIASFMINPIDKLWKRENAVDFREVCAMLDLGFGNVKPGSIAAGDVV